MEGASSGESPRPPMSDDSSLAPADDSDFQWSWAALAWSALLIALIVLGSWSWFDQVRYDPPLYGDDEATREALADLRIIATDEELPMSQDSESRWILGDGFGVPEEDGTWIAALRATLLFELEVPAASIDIFVYPLLSATLPERPISVTTAEGIFEFTLTGGGQWISAPLRDEISHEVILKCDTIESPLDLGLGPDQRKLCAKVISVRVNS